MKLSNHLDCLCGLESFFVCFYSIKKFCQREGIRRYEVHILKCKMHILMLSRTHKYKEFS
uniref:Uncharacterized protein n=1 Tax=Rhizophora mucronata TaxID=61149 RepID=A0A2P2PDS6_RHIMU